MKQQLLTPVLVHSLVALATLALVNCADPALAKYTVTFSMNGGIPAVENKTVETGKLLAQPTPDPTKAGYTFAGWHKDKELTQAFDFDTEKITANITLYAKWKAHLVTIPDANFRAKLKTLIPTAFVGEKLDATDGNVTGLTILGVQDSNIGDLTGIQYFTGLTELYCNSNRLTNLDVSNNTQLKVLNCEINQLTGLDVSNNTALTTLYCGINQLTGLDVSNNTALTTLYCGINQLAGLDVSNNTALTTLYCDINQLADLDVSNNTALTTLHCHNNRLTNLDMRGMRSIEDLSVQEATGETNVIETLKVHENLKDHAQIKAVKKTRGDEVTIFTYSATSGSATYTAVCNDYDPTEENEQDRCKEEAP